MARKKVEESNAGNGAAANIKTNRHTAKIKKARNVKKINLKAPLIVTAVVSALFFAGGGAMAYWGDGSYLLEKSATVKVFSPDEITNLGNSVSNDNFELEKDIHITESTFSVGESAYSGVFDGRGHTVYFDYATAGETTSFFPAIAKSGVVKNTRFVFSHVSVGGGFFSGVTKINYGTMQDCVVEYDLEFNAKEGAYTPFVNVNYGVIKNIVTSGTFTYDLQTGDNLYAATANELDANDPVTPPDEGDGEPDTPPDGEKEEPDDPVPDTDEGNSHHSAVKNDDEKKIAFAGACIYNFGELKNVISTPRYIGFYCTSRENYLAGRSENVAIAAVCSFTGGRSGSDAVPFEGGIVSIHEKALYTSDDARLTVYESFSSLIFDADGALIKTVIENTYDFNNNIWEIDEKALCLKLKIK